MSINDAALLILFSMELQPRSASLNVMTNTCLRNYFSSTISLEEVRYYVPFIKLLSNALQRMPQLVSNVVYKAVHADLSGNEEFRYSMQFTYVQLYNPVYFGV